MYFGSSILTRALGGNVCSTVRKTDAHKCYTACPVVYGREVLEPELQSVLRTLISN